MSFLRKSKFFIALLSLILFSSIGLKPILAAEKVESYEFSEQEMKQFNDTFKRVLEESELEEDITEIELVVDDSNFTTEFLLDDGSTITAEVNAVPGAETIPVTLIETVDGKEEKSEYLANIEEATEELDIKGDITDLSTEESFHFDTKDNHEIRTMAVVAVPTGIAMTLAAIYALAAIFYIVIANVVYVSVQKAKRDRTADHFIARRGSSDIYIGKKLTATQAYNRAKAGGDTWSVSKAKAKNVAREANKKGSPFSEVDKDKNGKPKKGKYYHWHPYQKKPNMHAFYGLPVK